METGFDDGLSTIITIPRDAGAAGIDAAQRLTFDLMQEGLVVKQKPSQGKGKIKRFEPVSALAENKMIFVQRGGWNDIFFDELESFGSGRGHDDCVDALSDLVYELITRKVSKPVSIPNMNNPTLLAAHRTRTQ
jgi:phage terminase large subunit-like protein